METVYRLLNEKQNYHIDLSFFLLWLNTWHTQLNRKCLFWAYNFRSFSLWSAGSKVYIPWQKALPRKAANLIAAWKERKQGGDQGPDSVLKGTFHDTSRHVFYSSLSCLFWEYIRKNSSRVLKSYCASDFHNHIIYNSQNMVTVQVYIHWQING